MHSTYQLNLLARVLSSAGSLESLQLGDEQITEDTLGVMTILLNSYESTVKQLEYAESFSEEQFVKSELDAKGLNCGKTL